MFKIGSFAVKEILFGVAQDFDDNIDYVLDQLTNASIEVSSDPTDITDKSGNVIRQIFKNKTATLSATSALLSPAIMNAGSGTDIEYASATNQIEMPKIVTVAAGASADIKDAMPGTIQVIGLYGNGANGVALKQSTTAVVDDTYALVDGVITVPDAGAENPVQYLVKYTRKVEGGMKLSNKTDVFPGPKRLTLFANIVDPCDDKEKPAYIYCPSAQADPSMTVSLDSESQTVDLSYNLQMNYCGGSKDLYFIFFPDEEKVVSATTTI